MQPSENRWPAIALSFVICGAMTLDLAACRQSRQTGDEAFSEASDAAAFEHLRDVAAAGDPGAQNTLGIHYYLGLRGPRDFDQARQWFKRAALARYPAAQFNLGMMYFNGLGTKRDFHRAYGWLHAAAEGGNARARAYLPLLTDNLTPNQMLRVRDAIAHELDQAATH
jgi:TPR repeat protein